MGCLLWIQHLTDILPEFRQLFMQYLTILDRVITALNCTYHLHRMTSNMCAARTHHLKFSLAIENKVKII